MQEQQQPQMEGKRVATRRRRWCVLHFASDGIGFAIDGLNLFWTGRSFGIFLLVSSVGRGGAGGIGDDGRRGGDRIGDCAVIPMVD